MSEGFGIPRTPFPGSPGGSGITVDVDGTPYPGITTLALVAGANTTLNVIDTTPTLTVEIVASFTDRPQELQDEYFVDDTLPEDVDARRYTSIADAIDAGARVITVRSYASAAYLVDLIGLPAGEFLTIRTLTDRSVIATPAVLDFSPMNGVPLEGRVAIEDCACLLAAYDLPVADGGGYLFRACKDDGSAGIAAFSLSGPIGEGARMEFYDCDFDNGLETAFDLSCGDIGEGTNPVVIIEDCKFFTACSLVQFFYLYEQVGGDEFGLTHRFDRSQIRVTVTADGALWNLNPGNTSLESQVVDSRILYESNADVAPLILFDGPLAPTGLFVTRNLRINAYNATQGAIDEGYLEPGAYLEEYLYDSGNSGPSTLIWETRTGATTITSADSPYEVLPEDRFILADTTGGAITVIPPDPAKCPGRKLPIKWVGASAVNAVTVTPDAGLIDGAASYAIPAQWGAVRIEANAGTWSNQ